MKLELHLKNISDNFAKSLDDLTIDVDRTTARQSEIYLYLHCEYCHNWRVFKPDISQSTQTEIIGYIKYLNSL